MTAQTKTSRQAAFKKKSGQKPLIYHLTNTKTNFIHQFQTNTIKLYKPKKNINNLNTYNKIINNIIHITHKLHQTITTHHNNIKFFRVTENDREDGEAML